MNILATVEFYSLIEIKIHGRYYVRFVKRDSFDDVIHLQIFYFTRYFIKNELYISNEPILTKL